jgi:hypothetical protein
MPSKKALLGAVALLANLLIIYMVPRFLTDALGADNPWTSFWFQYIMGALVFCNGVWLVMSAKACVLSRAQDRFWFKIMIFGFVCYFVVHAGWIMLAQNVAIRS